MLEGVLLATFFNVRTEGTQSFLQTKSAAPASFRNSNQARVALDHASDPLLFTTLYKLCPIDVTPHLNFQHAVPSL